MSERPSKLKDLKQLRADLVDAVTDSTLETLDWAIHKLQGMQDRKKKCRSPLAKMEPEFKQDPLDDKHDALVYGLPLLEPTAQDVITRGLNNIRKYRVIPDGQPCDHTGCLSHISHPCEGCGRIGGIPLWKVPTNTK